MVLQIYVHILISTACENDLTWQRDFADMIKELEMGEIMLDYLGI